tara:strand:- start:1719 stop:2060 length:342 start_codon:yes stop_codon:yes gene_type:complete
MDYSNTSRRYVEGTQPPNTRPHNASLASEIVPATELNLPYQTETTRPSNPMVKKILNSPYLTTEGDREHNTSLEDVRVEGGSFFGDLWSGIKEGAGDVIGLAAKAAPLLPLIL